MGLNEKTIALYPFVSSAKEYAGRAVVSYYEIEAAANSVLDAITRKAPGAKLLRGLRARAFFFGGGIGFFGGEDVHRKLFVGVCVACMQWNESFFLLVTHTPP